MKTFRIVVGAGAVLVAAALTAGFALAATPAAGGSCTKAGAKAKAGKTALTCTRQGKKLSWVAVKAAATTTAAAGGSVTVNLNFTGSAQVKQSGSLLDIKADATGTGSPLSSAHLTGAGQGNADAKPCPVFTGPGTIEGSGGDKLSFEVDAKSSGCPDAGDSNVVIVAGIANVNGGGGKYAKAKGALRFSGNFERNSGKLTMSFTGSITTS